MNSGASFLPLTTAHMQMNSLPEWVGLRLLKMCTRITSGFAGLLTAISTMDRHRSHPPEPSSPQTSENRGTPGSKLLRASVHQVVSPRLPSFFLRVSGPAGLLSCFSTPFSASSPVGCTGGVSPGPFHPLQCAGSVLPTGIPLWCGT